MIKAYCLVLVEPGKTSEVVKTLKSTPGIKSVEAVAGPYDLVVRAEVDSLEELSKIVFGKVRTTKGVTSTTTLIVIEV